MRLVEREQQLRCLARLLDESRSRRGQVVLLHGAPTTGKTELLRACTDQAPEDVRVLRATCSRAERSLPFGVLSQLLHSDHLPEDTHREVAELLREGVGALPQQDDDTVAPELVRIVHGLGVTVLDLASRAPLLIAVDDVQHADTPSLHCLLYLVRRLDSARVLLVLTDEEELDTVHSSFRAELLRQPHFHQLRLAPLSRAGVAEVLRARLGDPPTTRTTDTPSRPDGQPWDVDTYFHVSGGNPLLLNALVDDHLLVGEPRHQGYGFAVLTYLYRDKTLLLHVARALAILDGEGGVEDISQLTAVDIDAVCRAVNGMEAAGLIEKFSFRHPIARSAVLDGITAQDRAALHRRAAQLTHDRGAPATTVARHLVEAKHTHGPWAVGVLLEAAEQAMLSEQPASATECLKLAHRSSADEQERPAIRARLAQAEWETSPAAAARHLTPLVAAVRTGQLSHQDRRVLLRHLLWLGRTDEARTVLDHLRETAGSPHAPARDEAQDLELWLAATHPPLARRASQSGTRATPRSNPHPRGTSPARRTGTLISPLTDPWARSAAGLGELLVRGPDPRAADQAERILAETGVARRSPWTEEALQLGLLVLVGAGRLERATYWCDRLNGPSGLPHHPVRTATLSATRAQIALGQGDLTAAADNARDALDHLAPPSWGVALGLPLGSLMLAATRRGDYDEVAKCLTHTTSDAMFESRYGLHYLHARGHYHLATSHPHAALADFLTCGQLMREWGLDASALVPWRAGAAEAWLRLGNHDRAKHLVHDQLTMAGTHSPYARGLALRLLAATGPASRRPDLLTEALDLLEDCGDRYEQARVLVDLCHSYHGLEEHRRARMVFRRAWHVAKLCDARPLCEELLSASGNLPHLESGPATTDGITSLTGSERRVAALAVMGCTNREIAGKLHITASTVEQHLTRVYRKLNVKRRKDLPVDLRTDQVKAGKTKLGHH